MKKQIVRYNWIDRDKVRLDWEKEKVEKDIKYFWRWAEFTAEAIHSDLIFYIEEGK